MPGDIAFVRVLGPIQVVTTSGLALDLPSASQRRLLARLAVDAPRALRVDLLCDVLAVRPTTPPGRPRTAGPSSPYTTRRPAGKASVTRP